METYSVDILNPKAIQLLQDLADLELIVLHPKNTATQQPPLTATDRAEAHERIMRGSPDMKLDAMLEHLRESREDRKMPFRDEQ